MRKIIKRIWNALTTLLIGIIVTLAMLLWGVQLFGLEVFVVQSGSMEPEYRVGSVVYVRPTDPAQLQTGDVITFSLGGGVRGTHRIIEVLEEGDTRSFRTKGDANEVEDLQPVTPEAIVGKVIYTLPQLGFFVSYIQQPPGTYVAISVLAVTLLLSILPDILFPDPKEPAELPAE